MSWKVKTRITFHDPYVPNYASLVAEKRLKTELESYDSIAEGIKVALTEIEHRRR